VTQGFLFFDLDGTLAASGSDIRAAMDHVLADLGTNPVADNEISQLIGPPLQVGVPPLLQARGIDTSFAQEVIQRYRKIYKETYLPFTKAIDGMTEVVHELHESGWTMAVVTSKPQPQAGIAVRAAGLMDYFVTVVGPKENQPIPKDALLEHAMSDIAVRQRTEVSISRSWMIGDRHFDIDAAHAVGATSVGVLWGHGDEEEFVAAKAHHIVHVPADLLTLLESD
jgi:phosphoglycolate phosphatase